jgi:hypothetical protein
MPEQSAERKQEEQRQKQDMAARDEKDRCGEHEPVQGKSHGYAPWEEERESGLIDGRRSNSLVPAKVQGTVGDTPTLGPEAECRPPQRGRHRRSAPLTSGGLLNPRA